jgi:hypothetical protein
MLKIAVLGTSNSLMRQGWASAFTAAAGRIATVDNLSLGAAPSIYGAYMAAAADVARRYDYCLIDFCINDQQLVDIGQLRLEQAASAFHSLLAAFRAEDAACVPIVLILPQRDLIGAAAAPSCRDLHARLCDLVGVGYIDVYAALERRIAARGGGARDFLLDWAHLTPAASAAVARMALEAVVEAECARPAPRRAPVAHKAYGRATVSPRGPVAREEVGTSLRRLSCLRLGPGDGVDVGDAPYLAGVLHWADAESGPVAVAGVNRRITKFLRRDIERIFALTHFIKPIYGVHGVEVRYGARPDFPVESTFGLTKTNDHDGGAARIVDFVTCAGDPVADGAVLLRRAAAAAKGAGDLGRRRGWFADHLD